MIGKLKKGDQLLESLQNIFKGESGTLFAIGALEKIELAIYDLETKKYTYKSISGPLELTNLTAIVAKLPDGTTGVHAHACVCDKSFATYSGHLKEATVAATVEYSFFKNENNLQRYFDEEIGLNLLK